MSDQTPELTNTKFDLSGAQGIAHPPTFDIVIIPVNMGGIVNGVQTEVPLLVFPAFKQVLVHAEFQTDFAVVTGGPPPANPWFYTLVITDNSGNTLAFDTVTYAAGTTTASRVLSMDAVLSPGDALRFWVRFLLQAPDTGTGLLLADAGARDETYRTVVTF